MSSIVEGRASASDVRAGLPARRSSLARKQAIEGYLCILPWLIGFVCFTLGPMIFSLYISFFHWSVLGTPRFAGLDNYVNALSGGDPRFWLSWARTWTYALLFIPAAMAISLLLASMLNQKLKGTVIFRTLFFLPTLSRSSPRRCSGAGCCSRRSGWSTTRSGRCASRGRAGSPTPTWRCRRWS